MQLLLENGIDPYIRTITWNNNIFGKGSGQLAIHWAAESGFTSIIQLLYEFAPNNICLHDERLTTPLQLAQKEGKTQTVQVLKQVKQL